MEVFYLWLASIASASRQTDQNILKLCLFFAVFILFTSIIISCEICLLKGEKQASSLTSITDKLTGHWPQKLLPLTYNQSLEN